MWVPVVIHYINNNMAAVLTGSADLGNQVYGWKEVLTILVLNGILFVPFLFSKVYKERKENVSL